MIQKTLIPYDLVRRLEAAVQSELSDSGADRGRMSSGAALQKASWRQAVLRSSNGGKRQQEKAEAGPKCQ